jgi:hypothetical protein
MHGYVAYLFSFLTLHVEDGNSSSSSSYYYPSGSSSPTYASSSAGEDGVWEDEDTKIQKEFRFTVCIHII